MPDRDKNGEFLKGTGKHKFLKSPEEVLEAIDNAFKNHKGYVTMEKICDELEISTRTLRGWMQNDENYAKLRQFINDLNSDRVDEKALTGEYNAQYSIFFQKAKIGRIEYENQQRLEIQRAASLKPTQVQVSSDIFKMLEDKDIDSYKK